MPPRFTPLWSLSLGGPPGGRSRDETSNIGCFLAWGPAWVRWASGVPPRGRCSAPLVSRCVRLVCLRPVLLAWGPGW
eukprot:5320543-Amphidinium_carterae.1